MSIAAVTLTRLDAQIVSYYVITSNFKRLFLVNHTHLKVFPVSVEFVAFCYTLLVKKQYYSSLPFPCTVLRLLHLLRYKSISALSRQKEILISRPTSKVVLNTQFFHKVFSSYNDNSQFIKIVALQLSLFVIKKCKHWYFSE